MDKQSPKILVKVNGTETEYKEGPVKQENEEFQWMLPSAEVQNVVPFRAVSEQKQETAPKKKAGGKRLLLTIGTAVLLGTGFGLGVLQVLNSTKSANGTTAAPVTAPAQPQAEKPADTSSQPKQAATVLQGLTVYMVQGNVFSTVERGEAALADIKGKGAPGALADAGGKTALLIGIMNDEAGAKQLAAAYKTKGFSALSKQRTIAGGAVPEAFKSNEPTLVQTEAAMRSLIEKTSTLYTGGSVAAVQWSELDQLVQEAVKEESSVKQEALKKLFTYVALSHKALQDYQETKKEAEFVKLQQLLLDGMIAYEAVMGGKGS